MQTITFHHNGDFSKTDKFLARLSEVVTGKSMFDKYGERGVEALREATPRDTGETANSWTYDVQNTKDGTTITWSNSHVNKGVNIAMILQYGHGTRQGGYVKGIDYINPAIKPIFEQMANEAWTEVTSV